MSQYPSPYHPPTPQYPMTFDYYRPGGGGDDGRGPNRRASILTCIVAAFLLLGGVCCAGTGAMLPQMMAQDPAAFADLSAQLPQFTPNMMRAVFIVLGVLGLLGAVAMIVLGIFVR